MSRSPDIHKGDEWRLLPRYRQPEPDTAKLPRKPKRQTEEK